MFRKFNVYITNQLTYKIINFQTFFPLIYKKERLHIVNQKL